VAAMHSVGRADSILRLLNPEASLIFWICMLEFL
jgi:hypothetical protein